MRREIEDLLGEPLRVVAEREQSTFGQLLADSDGSVVLFGAGRLGRLCARALRKAGIPLRAFCDSNQALHGTMVEGAAVISPAQAAADFGSGSLFCVAIWTGSAWESMCNRLTLLRDLGCHHVTTYAPLVWALGKDEIPFHSFDLPSRILANGGTALRKLAASLEDDGSIATLNVILRQRLLGDFTDGTPVPDQYFVPGISSPNRDEVLVDGGAYSGDTLSDFIARTDQRFVAYHAFEPDPKNAQKLRATIAALPIDVQSRIVVHESGLFSHTGTIGFAGSSGVSSSIAGNGSTRIAITALDEVRAPVTFLKLDIEGAELDALKGGAGTLARFKPRLAICVYHKSEDLWTIPEFVRETLPDHRIFLRQHGYDGWELVLYAVPRS